jgi:two-component system, chemotaxis family, chemotaxis protein CheY
VAIREKTEVNMSNQVLVIDDESVTRRLVTHALKTIQVDIISAENGTEAIALAKQNDIQLAFVDINLPDIDGFTLLKELKAMPHLADTPMYVFTARNSADDKEIALEMGAEGFFYKPFSTQELRDLVSKHLKD